MASHNHLNDTPRPPRTQRRRGGWTIRITPTGFILLMAINFVIVLGLAVGLSQILKRAPDSGQLNSISPTNTAGQDIALASDSATITPTSSPSVSPVNKPIDTASPETPTAPPQPISTMTLNQGLIIIALDEGGNTHLFAYQPKLNGDGQPLPLTRLTYGPWDDINPAISPDGQRVAFASNRSGYWDIYLLALDSGGISRLTDTLAYEGAPAWSPDNKWLVFEAYIDGNLELMIQSIQNADESMRLTSDPAGDFSPAWSPDGRKIAFVSNRSGENEIWVADLEKSEDSRFKDVSLNPSGKDTHPAWSPDGTSLIWVSEKDGIRNIVLQELNQTNNAAMNAGVPERRNLGNGDWPIWIGDSDTVLTLLQAPNHTYMTAYPAHYQGLVLPTIDLPGPVEGLAWGMIELASPIPAIYQQAAQVTSTALYIPSVTAMPGDNGDRYQLAQLIGVEAPQPYLHDLTDESFQALRTRIASDVGWDFLSRLENAYVPLTTPLDPGMGNDWLYTGRAFSFNSQTINAGWLQVVREDFGLETYWRVYLRSIYQDGSSGVPLHDQPWDFNSRYNGEATSYEQGGALLTSIPQGYWIDFTERAIAYGWERQPALTTWRASVPAARFNEFALTGGLTWESAMLELYPPEVLITPTAVIPPTRTLTPTYRWYVSPTPTATATPRPTFTPAPQTLPGVNP